MTREERHETIMAELIKHGSIGVTELATLLEVSSVTIRKDLNELEQENRLYRSHGKAILTNPYINNRSVNEKEKLATEEKMAIGHAAAEMITKDDSIIIASGTTVHALAHSIRPIHKLTVISASLRVSEILAAEEAIDIIQLGGIMRHSSCSVVGKYAESTLQNFCCSKLFLGVDGIDLDHGGLTTTDVREAELNREMMKIAQKTVVLADASKFRRRGFSKICNIEDVDVIVTDSGIPAGIADHIRELGIELVIAKKV